MQKLKLTLISVIAIPLFILMSTIRIHGNTTAYPIITDTPDCTSTPTFTPTFTPTPTFTSTPTFTPTFTPTPSVDTYKLYLPIIMKGDKNAILE